MDKVEMLYDLVKEIRDDMKVMRADLNRHIAGVEQNRRRLVLLEKRAIQINWKTICVFCSICASLAGFVYYVSKF